MSTDPRTEGRCHHCGKPPEADGDHTCPCPLSDSECLEHTLNPIAAPLPTEAGDVPLTEKAGVAGAVDTLLRADRAALAARETETGLRERVEAVLGELLNRYPSGAPELVCIAPILAALDQGQTHE